MGAQIKEDHQLYIPATQQIQENIKQPDEEYQEKKKTTDLRTGRRWGVEDS